MEPFTYLLPLTLGHKKLESTLPSTPYRKISFQKGEKCQAVLLDTFEAEMFHSKKMLFQVGERLFIVSMETGQLLEQPVVKDWQFAGDLPVGPVSVILLNISKLRAFLPVVKVEIRQDSGALLDDEGKTRVRFNNLTISHGRKTVGLGCPRYLRGYDQAYKDLCRAFEKIGAIRCQDVGQVYESLAIRQGEYTIKPTILLKPDDPAKKAADTIITAFIQNARQNEKGLIADLDTEFLHHYRVSLRKVRSVLSLFKEVYGLEDTLALKRDFAALMQNTNTLRDLDVYLLTRENYFSLVPADTCEGLEILFDYFKSERKKAHESVVTFMSGKNYQREINRLNKLFSDSAFLSEGPNGAEKSLGFSCRLIRKRYDKVCKIARSMDDQTEDKVVHELRINCKKLRYLMEFFAPLFPEAEMKTLIKALKQLQDNLGNFNDYSVQQMFLRQLISEKIAVFGKAKIQVARSVGALTAMLSRLQQKERRRVMKNFAFFDSDDVRTIIVKLFQTEDSVDENNSLLQQ